MLFLELLLFFFICAIVACNIFIVRILIIIIRYKKWCKFAVPAVGTVGELKDVNCIHGRRGQVTSYRYDYAFKIISGDQEFDNIYSENCKPDDMPAIHPGKKINILWSEYDHKYLVVTNTRDEIWQIIKQEANYAISAAMRFIGRRP